MKVYPVLIPAYQPDERLLGLVEDLLEKNIDVTVVDDGSGAEYSRIFEKASDLGASVLYHEKNRGKGAAIKTGLNAIMENGEVLGVVTADADGQHTTADIGRVIDAMMQNPGVLVIGARAFTGKVPWKSRFGNGITRVVFRFVTGLKVTDTQTGLRGLPKNLFPELIRLKGERYEYEMNMLLNLQRWNIKYLEVPITTVYIEGNAGSHFHPLRDSWRIYGKILKFGASSFASFLVDYGAYALFSSVFGLKAWAGYALARVISSFINYMINRHIVFGDGRGSSLFKYYALAAGIMLAGSSGVTLLTMIGVHSLLAKLVTDIPLFLVSYTIQRKYIFKSEREG
jgi:glycosyltransferase involved in cell wall biosynthesis